MELVELHDHPEYMNACCNILNNEWKRSHAARFHSLSKSSSNLPASLALIKHQDDRESQVIGHAKLCRVLHDDKACFIESVIVIPEERGKGFGKLVMKLTEDYARKKGFTRCYLSTHDKEQFYRGIGYTVCPPVCGVSGTMDHMERFLRLFDVKASESSPQDSKSLTHGCSPRETHVKNTNQLPPPPPPPPLPPLQVSPTLMQVWMMKQL